MAARRWPGLEVLGLLVGFATAGVFVVSAPPPPPEPPPPLPPMAPVLVAVGQAPVVTSHERATPERIRETSGLVRPPWNLGLSLVATERAAHWRDHRALIEDGQSGLRAYAIGDLLPYSAVLVGISTGAVQLMIGDVELVQLDTEGEVSSLQDFRTAYDPPRLKAAKTSARFRRSIREVQGFLRSSKSREVQGAIDALIAAGAPAAGIIAPFADSTLAVATTATQSFTFGPSGLRRPRVYGDLVIGILEVITQQSFGDPMAPGISAEERAAIRARWITWWGVR